MRLPRDVSGAELARLLRRFGYELTRQTGSHLRLTTQREGEHTSRSRKPIRCGSARWQRSLARCRGISAWWSKTSIFSCSERTTDHRRPREVVAAFVLPPLAANRDGVRFDLDWPPGGPWRRDAGGV